MCALGVDGCWNGRAAISQRVILSTAASRPSPISTLALRVTKLPLPASRCSRHFGFAKKPASALALLPVPLADRSGVEFRLLGERELANPAGVMAENPQLADVGSHRRDVAVVSGRGTMNRSGVWCPASGRPGLIALTMNDLRRQGQQGLLGMQMTAVVVEATVGKKTRKRYRLPTDADLRADRRRAGRSGRSFPTRFHLGFPTSRPRQGGGSGASRAFSLHKYGLKTWRDIFTPRQLLALGVFVNIRATRFVELQKLYPDQPEIAEG